MTKPAADFDVEKRRRCYAACLGAAGATSVVAIFLITEDLSQLNEPLWVTSLILFAFWFFFFIFKFVAGYAIWYQPFSTRRRAVVLSLIATLVVYIALTGAALLFVSVRGIETQVHISDAVKSFVALHKALYGLPYIAAAIVGWIFARPAPDVREQF